MNRFEDQPFFIPSLETINNLQSYSVEETSSKKPKLLPSSDAQEAKPVKVPKKPGRKLAQTEPANKRVAQNRVAQRLFRQRRIDQVKDLQDQVESLKAQMEGRGIPIVDDSELRALRLRVSELEAENAALRSVHGDGKKAKGSESKPAEVEPALKQQQNIHPDTLALLNNANAAALSLLATQNGIMESVSGSDSPFGGLFPGLDMNTAMNLDLSSLSTPVPKLDGFLFENCDLESLLDTDAM